MTEQNPIIGDLVEEYREVVRPSRGRIRAAIWFAGQLASLVRPWMWGVLLGVTLGTLNLASTMLAPMADDDAPTTLALGAAILGLWTLVGFAAERRRFQFGDAIRGGMAVALLSTVIFGAEGLARRMLFLDILQHRNDWIGLMLRFQASGSDDLRAFVLNEYLRGLPLAVIFSIAAGALCGALGGAISAARRERLSRASA